MRVRSERRRHSQATLRDKGTCSHLVILQVFTQGLIAQDAGAACLVHEQVLTDRQGRQELQQLLQQMVAILRSDVVSAHLQQLVQPVNTRSALLCIMNVMDDDLSSELHEEALMRLDELYLSCSTRSKVLSATAARASISTASGCKWSSARQLDSSVAVICNLMSS